MRTRISKIEFLKRHLMELKEFKRIVREKHASPSRDTIIVNIEKAEEHLLTLLKAAHSGISH